MRPNSDGSFNVQIQIGSTCGTKSYHTEVLTIKSVGRRPADITADAVSAFKRSADFTKIMGAKLKNLDVSITGTIVYPGITLHGRHA